MKHSFFIETAVFFVFALLTLLMSYPALFHVTNIELGDPALNSWILASNSRAIWSNPLDIFNTNIFYPLENTLTFSDPLIAPSLFFSLIFILTKSTIISHNIIILSNYLLTAFITYFLCKEITHCRKSALFGGFVFAFCHFTMSHLMWVQLGAQWLPFTILFLIRYRKNGSIWNVTLFYCGILIQIYSGLYYFIYLFLVVVLFFFFFFRDICYIATERRKYYTGLLIGGIITVVLALPLIVTYTETHQQYQLGRTYMDLIIGRANIYNYLMPQEGAPFFELYKQKFGLPKLYWEKYLFPGVIVLVLSCVALVALINDIVKREKDSTYIYIIFFLIAGSFFLFLSLGPNRGGETSLFSIVSMGMPGLLGIRVPARAGVVVSLAFAVISAYGLKYIITVVPYKKVMSSFLFILCIFLAGYEFWTPSKGYGKYSLSEDFPVPAVYQWINNNVDEDEAIIHLPFETPHGETKRMYYSTFHWRNMVNGYSGYRSGFAYQLKEDGIEQLNSGAIMKLKKNSVRYIIIDMSKLQIDHKVIHDYTVVFDNGRHMVVSIY